MIQIDSSSLIIYDGSVYGLTVKEKFCQNVRGRDTCDFCALRQNCPSTELQLCTILGASWKEFYVECGVVECDKETNYIHILPISGYKFI